MLAACGTSEDSPPADAGGGGTPPEFPVTVENCGRTLTFDEPPSRAVLTYHPLVETFMGLGLGDRAIARALGRSGGDFYVLPLPEDQAAAIEKIPIVSDNYFPPPKEQMLALRSDFLLAWGESDTDQESGLASVEELEAVGVQTYQVVCPGSDASDSQALSNTYNLILDLGKIFGVSDRAEARVAEMRARIAAVAEQIAGRTPVKVLAYYGGEGPLSVAGGRIVTELLALAGAENVFSGGLAYPEPSLEAVAGRPVDAFLIFADVEATRTGKLEDTKAAEFLYRTFPNMPASRDRRSVFITEYYFSPGAWRHAEGVEVIARALHPDAFP